MSCLSRILLSRRMRVALLVALCSNGAQVVEADLCIKINYKNPGKDVTFKDDSSWVVASPGGSNLEAGDEILHIARSYVELPRTKQDTKRLKPNVKAVVKRVMSPCPKGCPAKNTKPDPNACPKCYGTGRVPDGSNDSLCGLEICYIVASVIVGGAVLAATSPVWAPILAGTKIGIDIHKGLRREKTPEVYGYFNEAELKLIYSAGMAKNIFATVKNKVDIPGWAWTNIENRQDKKSEHYQKGAVLDKIGSIYKYRYIPRKTKVQVLCYKNHWKNKVTIAWEEYPGYYVVGNAELKDFEISGKKSISDKKSIPKNVNNPNSKNRESRKRLQKSLWFYGPKLKVGDLIEVDTVLPCKQIPCPARGEIESRAKMTCTAEKGDHIECKRTKEENSQDDKWYPATFHARYSCCDSPKGKEGGKCECKRDYKSNKPDWQWIKWDDDIKLNRIYCVLKEDIRSPVKPLTVEEAKDSKIRCDGCQGKGQIQEWRPAIFKGEEFKGRERYITVEYTDVLDSRNGNQTPQPKLALKANIRRQGSSQPEGGRRRRLTSRLAKAQGEKPGMSD